MLHHSARSAAALLLLLVAAACGADARGDAARGGAGNGRQGGGGSGGGQAGGPGGRGGPGNNRPTPVEVITVARGTVARTTTVAGMLEPLRTVGVNAQLSGPLRSVRVEEGHRVREGQVLADIDARELEAQEASAVASLEFAESTAKRSDDLFKQKIITAAEYERDRAALASAKATLDQLRTRLGYATIRAPITGVITEKQVETGDIVSPQSRLFAIADISMLVSRVMVSELDVASLRAGNVVDVSVDALSGEHFQGRIRRVFPAADSATRLVPVEVALTGPVLERLRPGYTIRAVFRLGVRTDALLVPTRAVLGPIGARAVFIITEGKAERRPVRVGPDVDGSTEVFEGLQEGDSVVVAGNALLREGGAVRVVPPLAPVETARTATPRAVPDSARRRTGNRRSE